MSVLSIVQYPDPRLTTPCEKIRHFDHPLTRLLSDLTETLYATTGIGLSAPQIGCLQRVFVMDLSESQDDPQFFINPEIVDKSGLGIADEACLSLPRISAKIIRSATVRVRAQDRDGQAFEVELDGLHAICAQHEMDHLDGILFIDRLSALRRLAFRSALKSLEQAVELEATDSHGKKSRLVSADLNLID